MSENRRKRSVRSAGRSATRVITLTLTLTLALAVAAYVAVRLLWPQPILVGFAGQLTGKRSDLGVQGRNGALLAIEELNAAGGVSGRPLRLLARDDRDTPDGARETDIALADAGVVAIIGHMTSSQSLAGTKALAGRDVPLISPTTATPLLSGLDDGFFRVITVNTEWARALALHARAALDIQTVFVVGDADNAGYTDTFNTSFVRAFTDLGGSVSGQLSFSSADISDGSWKEAAETVAKASPDAALVTASASDVAALAKALHEAGSTARLLCPSWPRTRALIVEGGSAVEGAVFASSFDPDLDEPRLRDFTRRYRERFGWPPGFPAVFAYESALVLANGLSMTGGSREGLSRALAPAYNLPGIIGPINLDSYGDARRPVYVSTVENGRFTQTTLIEPTHAP